jgi:carotenoid cleavage dioxygenase-like enzyme
MYHSTFLFCIFFARINLTQCFFPFKFGPSFRILSKEINKPIPYQVSIQDLTLIKKINGFYGLIGPDINITTVESLYDLFTGNGYIQGVFFENGNIQYIKHIVRTDKILYEEKNGVMPKNMEVVPFFTAMNKMGIFPNTMNIANTALMYLNDSLYALFERDLPIMLRLDFANKTVETIGRQHIDGLDSFSAHSVCNPVDEIVETIDYNVLNNRVKYACLNSTLHVINDTIVETTYLPIIHDFITNNDSVVFMDSPFVVEIKRLLTGKMPVVFNPSLSTNLYVLNKTDFSRRIYNTDKSMYIFHYADMVESDTTITLYGSIYKSLDLSTITIKGCYSRIEVNKITGSICVFTSDSLKNANLDFPVKWGPNIILRNMNRLGANQFVICNELTVIGTIDLKNRYICGEPQIIDIDETQYLMFFAYDDEKDGYLMLVDLSNQKRRIELPLNVKIGIGFHSIFVKGKGCVYR